MTKEDITTAESRLYEKFYSLEKSTQDKILQWYGIHSVRGLYQNILEQAKQNKRHADRHDYGAGEMGYTSREIREEAEEQESTKHIASELAHLYRVILDYLFESEI
jgi:predicted transposase YdaD